MQNPLSQPAKGQSKLLMSEKQDLENSLKQNQNLVPELKKTSSRSKIIKKSNGKSTVAKIVSKENIQAIANQYVHQNQSNIQEEISRKDAKRMPLLALESVPTEPRKHVLETATSHDPSTLTELEEGERNVHLSQDRSVKTIHMSESEIERLDERARMYIRYIEPDQEYIKCDLENYETNYLPHDCARFVIVTKEDNKWRKEFEHQERIPEGTVLLRPQVTMSILVAMIVCQSPDKMLMPYQVYAAIQKRFPYFLYMPKKEQLMWKKGVRHTLIDNKWFSKVTFPGHNFGSLGSYWIFNYNQTMPDNWNFTAHTIGKAIRPCSESKRVSKVQGSSTESIPPPRTSIIRDELWNAQIEDSCDVPTTSAMSQHFYSSNPDLCTELTTEEGKLTTDQTGYPFSQSCEPRSTLFQEFGYQACEYDASHESSYAFDFSNSNLRFENEIGNRPGNCAANIWEVHLPNLPNLAQILSPAILSETLFESTKDMTEI